MGCHVIVVVHRFLTMKRYLIFLFGIFIAYSGFAQSSTERDIISVYQDGVYHGNFTEDNFNIIKNIDEESLVNATDSVRYYYHYLRAAIIDMEDGDVNEKLRHIDLALKLRENSLGIQDSEYLELLWAKGSDLAKTNPTRAMAALQRGVVVGKNMLEKRLPSCAIWYGRLLQELGDLYVKRNYIDQAISLYKEGFPLTSQFFERDDATSWSPMLSLDNLFYNLGRFSEAADACDEIIKHLQANNAQDSYHYAIALEFKGNALFQQGKTEEATNNYNSALEIARKYPAEDYSQLIMNLHHAYVTLGKFDDAVQLHSEISTKLKQTGDAVHYAGGLNSLGVDFLLANNGTASLPLLEEASSVYSANGLNQTFEYAINLHNLGRAHMLIGDKITAKEYLEKSKRLQVELNGQAIDRTIEYLEQLN